MRFNEKLIELRRKEGWSQEELGDKLEVSRQTVSKWELGQTTPEMNKLIQLSELFKISLDELIVGKENISKEKVVYVKGYHYEYKSKSTLGGIPLVHVNIGKGFYRAKGLIAIGNISTGIISIGFTSLGLLSLGFLSFGLLAAAVLSIGIFSIGAVAIGTLAIGGVSIGYFTIGGVAIGTYSIGGCAIAEKIAIGGYANGHIAVGNTVNGTYEFVTENFKDVDVNEFKRTILKAFPNTRKFIIDIFTSLLSNIK